MIDLTQYRRRATHEVRIGACTIGGTHPVAVQSMTNTDTNDTEASVAQIERIDRAGGHIVRLTAQGRREGENLGNIVRQLRADGFRTAVVADIHFVPEVAAVAAKYVDKVRINPGNYRTDHGEFEALIEQCRERGVALRIGVNHGSLAKRVFDQWGDTPQGMVVSAMEFLRVCKAHGFDQVVVSMKSSNTRVMVAAYRLLVAAMDAEDMHYPIHLGVTEAGSGIDELERELVKYLVKYGEQNFEYVEGKQVVELNVAEVIIADLDKNGIRMKNPAYRKIYDEYKRMRATGEPVETHALINHTDPDVCSAVVDLLTGDDNYAVSRLWQKFDIVVESEQQRLPVAVPRAVILYKSKVIDEIIAELRAKLADPSLPEDELAALTHQIAVLNQERTLIAKRLSRLIV